MPCGIATVDKRRPPQVEGVAVLYGGIRRGLFGFLQGRVDVHGLAAAADRNGHGLVDVAALHIVDEVIGGVHGGAVEGGDDVTGLDAGLVCRCAGADRADQRTGVVVGG